MASEEGCESAAMSVPKTGSTREDWVLVDPATNEELFATKSSFGTLHLVLWSLGLLVGLLLVAMGLSRSQLALSLVGFILLVSLGILYALLVPQSLHVDSDATVSIQTRLYRYSFGNAVLAQKDPSLWESSVCLKFATNCNSRVLVHRSKGRQKILVTPHDVDGFVAAVHNARTLLNQANNSAFASSKLAKSREVV